MIKFKKASFDKQFKNGKILKDENQNVAGPGIDEETTSLHNSLGGF